MGEKTSNPVLYCNGQPIGALTEIPELTSSDEDCEGISSFNANEQISLTATVKLPSGKTRKRLMKLLMACGMGRNNAYAVARYLGYRCGSYRAARFYVWLIYGI